MSAVTRSQTGSSPGRPSRVTDPTATPGTATPGTATPAAPKKKARKAPAQKAPAKALTRDEIIKRLNKNPRGVMLISQGSLDQTPLMAGYVLLRNTAELKARISEIAVLPMVKKFNASRKLGFGIPNKSGVHPWSVKNIIERTHDPNFVSEVDFASGLPVSEEKFPHSKGGADNDDRGYASWIVTLRYVYRAYPDNFPAMTPSKPTLSGIHTENWHRAYWLLRGSWRSQTASRASTGKGLTKDAIEPVFGTEEVLRSAAGEEASTLATGNDDLDNFLRDEAEAVKALERADEEEAANGPASDATIDYIVNDFENSFRSVTGRLSDIDRRNWMPALDDRAKKVTLAILGQEAKVLWGLQGIVPKARIPGSRGASQMDKLYSDMIQEAAVEEAVLDGTKDREMEDDKREQFWELHRLINTASSHPDSYEACCTDMAIDPFEPRVGDVLMKPWQVTGAWWTLYQLRFGLGSALIADDVGLGKTLQSLCALQVSVDLACADLADEASGIAGSQKLSLCGPYKPTLILCPPAAFEVWKDEIGSLPAMKLMLWAGSKTKAEVANRGITLGTSSAALEDHVNQFKSDDPRTALQIVLTTYQTFHSRTLDLRTQSARSRKGKGPQVPDEEVETEDEDEEVEEEEKELSEEQLSVLVSKTPGLFGVVIADESHKLKNARTRTHQAVAKVMPQQLVLITATPTINRTSDLYGTLSLMWNNLRPTIIDDQDIDLEEEEGEPIEQYEEASNEVQESVESKTTPINLVPIIGRARFLNPWGFRKIVHAEGQLSTSTAAKVLPIILHTIQLRRIKGEKMTANGEEVTIGGDIPPYEVITMELEMGHAEAKRYTGTLKALLSKGERPSTKRGLKGFGKKLDIRTHRHLCHVTVHPGLDNLLKAKNVSAAKIGNWNERSDYGYATFHRLAALDPTTPAYRERVGATSSIVSPSVKLQALCSIVHDVCIAKDENLIVFMAWPITQWVVEMLLMMTGVNVLSIRAQHSRTSRSQTQALFNSPMTRSTVLVTNLLVSATSMNLQKNCANMVFVEPPGSANIMSQAIGRIHRLGQEKKQNIYVLTTNYSYDQVQQARAAQKMYSQIAGSADIRIRREDMLARRATMDDTNPEDEEGPPLTEEALTQKATEELQQEMVVSMYMRAFGQRSARDQWGNMWDPTAKDALESENQLDRTITGNLAIEEIFEAAVADIEESWTNAPADQEMEVNPGGQTGGRGGGGGGRGGGGGGGRKRRRGRSTSQGGSPKRRRTGGSGRTPPPGNGEGSKGRGQLAEEGNGSNAESQGKVPDPVATPRRGGATPGGNDEDEEDDVYKSA
ncbi:hypothetical protein VE04_08781 [Pseudogymnoascus sp. 24MN13]|nr:hypothetical protein VE04_08781 [Pseudogymnoascus sp. 24MN13]